MAFPDDLLSDAKYLMSRGGKTARQSSLRRAVSTAYYALFHLLTAEFVANWKTQRQRAILGRALQHGAMKQASNLVRGQAYPNSDPGSASKLKSVAKAFADLQQHRHVADYDTGREWERGDVEKILQVATDAFADWQAIRKEAIAQDYLMAMLGPRNPG
jgi:uncharacterized protein (UPF0332 family)